MPDVLIVAEAGVNHDGDLRRAKDLVIAAASSGADAIKFQTYKTECLVRSGTAKAQYQRHHSHGSDQYEMLKQLELSDEAHLELGNLALEQGIEFMSTPFDVKSLRFLVDVANVSRLKISSGDLTNLPLVHAAASTGLPLILSTGMATLEDAALALGAVRHGRLQRKAGEFAQPGRDAFLAMNTHLDADALARDVTLLQCTSEYPTATSDTNLRSMTFLADELRVPVGLSDHTLGFNITVAAVALGATTIEKHLTLNSLSPGPDHRASLEPRDFAAMVGAIREVESALGSGGKRPTPGEAATSRLVRRGLYASRDIESGHILTEADIAFLRPENGISPLQYWSLLGAVTTRSFKEGESLWL